MAEDDFHEELRPRDDNPEGISRFEIKARTWAAEAGIVESAHTLTEQYDLDPLLAEDLDDAYRRQDSDDWDTALRRFMQALVEAGGTE